jgi:hypothetical protein
VTAIRLATYFLVFLCCCATSVTAASLRVAVISDLNGSYGSVDYAPAVSRAVSRIIALKPDLVISTGDMVAGQRRPHLSESDLRAMWNAFHEVVTEPLERAGIPFVVSPGNHDASAYSGFERERAIYEDEWRERRPDLPFVDGEEYPFSYAFDLGGVRFASLDVTTIGPLEADEARWLSNAMGGAGPTRILFSHLPLWPFATGRETEAIGDPKLERLLAELDIDLHLSGHHHAFYPGVVNGLGVVSQACLGAGPRTLIGDSGRSERAITLLEISETGEIAVSAITGPDFDEPLDIGALPRMIRTDQRTIERLDLSPVSNLRWRKDARGITD